MIISITQGGGPELGKSWIRNICTLPQMQHLWTGTRLAPLFYWHWWKSPEKLDGQEEKQGRVFTTNPKHGTVLPATSARADFSEIKTLAMYYCINCAGKIGNLNRKYFFQLVRLTRLLAWALMQNCGSDWVAAIFVGKVSQHERCNKRHRPGHVGTNDWLLMGVALSGVNKTSFFLFEHS